MPPKSVETVGLRIHSILFTPKSLVNPGGADSKIKLQTLVDSKISLKVLSSKNKQGSKLDSNDKHCFSVVVLDIIFNFFKDTILDSLKNFVPPLKPKKLKFDTRIRRCCKSLQHQIISKLGTLPCGFSFNNTNKLELQSLYHLTNGATKSLAPNKWCYHFTAPINKIVKRENLLLIFIAPLTWC